MAKVLIFISYRELDPHKGISHQDDGCDHSVPNGTSGINPKLYLAPRPIPEPPTPKPPTSTEARIFKNVSYRDNVFIDHVYNDIRDDECDHPKDRNIVNLTSMQYRCRASDSIFMGDITTGGIGEHHYKSPGGSSVLLGNIRPQDNNGDGGNRIHISRQNRNDEYEEQGARVHLYSRALSFELPNIEPLELASILLAYSELASIALTNNCDTHDTARRDVIRVHHRGSDHAGRRHRARYQHYGNESLVPTVGITFRVSGSTDRRAECRSEPEIDPVRTSCFPLSTPLSPTSVRFRSISVEQQHLLH